MSKLSKDTDAKASLSEDLVLRSTMSGFYQADLSSFPTDLLFRISYGYCNFLSYILNFLIGKLFSYSIERQMQLVVINSGLN